MNDTNSDKRLSPLQDREDAWWQAVLSDDGTGDGNRNQSNENLPPSSYGNIEVDWELVKQLAAKDTILECEVIDHNHGGLLVVYKEFHGFVPRSHLINVDPIQKKDQLDRYLGRKLKLRIIEIDPSRSRLVLSQRAALADTRQRKSLLMNMKVGDRLEGPVTNITKFGVFVDLGGIEGLIHISELSWGRITHPKEALEWGQNVKVFVLNVDRSVNRVALSLKRLYPNPWITVADRYQQDDEIIAEITEVTRFGAFLRLESNLEGLLHISEMDLEEGQQPWNKYNKGTQLRVRIIRIDPKNHRIGFTLIKHSL